MSKHHRTGRLKGVIASFVAVCLAAFGLLATPLLSSSSAFAGTANDSASGSTITVSPTPTTGLVATSAISIPISTSGGSPQAKVASTNVRVCRPGTGALLFQGDTFDFGFSANQCAKGQLPGGSGYGVVLASPVVPNLTSTSLNITIGAGTVNWLDNSSTARSLTCDASTNATPCELVVEVGLDSGGGNVYVATPLTFAGTPAAPTAVSASNADGTSHVVWTAANPNGSTIDHYIITATKTSGAGSNHTLQVGNVLFGDIPLDNFSVYSITVHAHTSDAVVPQDGPESNTITNVTPLPAGPTGVSGLASGGSVDVSWTAPVFTSGLGSYQIVSSPVTTTQCSNGTGTTFHFPGLTDGTPYTFVVTASYSAACAGPFGLPSSASSPVSPAGARVLQQITVTRPAGALVLTQACDTTNPTPYPVDVNGVPNPVYPTTPAVYGGSCGIIMPTPTFITDDTPVSPTYPFIGEGQFFKSDAQMHQVAVVETRDSDPGYDVNGVLTDDFRIAGSTATHRHFSAHQLGWEPGIHDHSASFSTPDQTYTQVMTAGAIAKPSAVQGLGAPALSGLGSARPLINHVAAGQGLGIARLDADLHLLIPVWAAAGTYTTILQITAA